MQKESGSGLAAGAPGREMTRLRLRYTCIHHIFYNVVTLSCYQIDIEGIAPTPRLDLSRPRYDQSTFTGRAKHFIETTDPRNLLVSHEKLEAAATLVKQYK